MRMLAWRPGVPMAASGSPGVEDPARRDAALARIARARRPDGPTQADGTDRAMLATRLDALIAELRSVLGRDQGD